VRLLNAASRRATLDSSQVVALRDQSGLAREKVLGRDRAMAIPARKVFWEATPVAEAAAQVPPDQASSVLRRASAASIPPEILESSIAHGAATNNLYIAVLSHSIVEALPRF
jgi:hypothetical protein